MGDCSRVRSSVSRRRILGSLGAAGVVALAGCSWGGSGGEGDTTPTSTPAGSETPPGKRPTVTKPNRPVVADEYDTVINLADAGADRTGSESIVPYFERHAADSTLLYLPQGRYLMDDWWKFSSFSNFGIYGNGATIVPPRDNDDDSPLFILGGSGATALRVEGIRFDFTADSVGPRSIYAVVRDGLSIRDIAVDGSSRAAVRFDVTAPDGAGRVERLRLPDGGLGKTPTGCYIGKDHRGTLTMANCHVEGFYGTGIYASNAPGTIRVIGGKYVNNGISNVRVGSGDLVRNVVVRCVDPPERFPNMRGIWVLGPGTTIENCRVDLKSVPRSDGAVVIGSTATVRNTTINVDSDEIAAILGNDPRRRPGKRINADDSNTKLEQIQITGKATGGSAVYLVNHDDFEATELSVSQTGASRNGFRLVNVDRGKIVNSIIDVTGQAVLTENSEVSEVDVSTDRPDPRSASARRDSNESRV